MKKRLQKLTALCLAFCLIMTMTSFAAANLSDIKGHPAEEQILKWQNYGLTKGFSDGTFRPDNPVTRAEFFALMNRAFGFFKEGATSFSDVSARDWFASDISKANGQGYLEGYSDNTVRPDKPISRQELVKILCKVLKLKPDTAKAKVFADADSFAEWSKGYIGAAYDIGCIKPYPDKTFRPERNATRAEVVDILDRAAGRLFMSAGSYGSDEGNENIKGNATVSKPGVTLKNMVIEGNLYLTEGIGDGAVSLKNVTVRGNTVISVGGRSIIEISGDFGSVEILSADTQLKILKGTVNLLLINGSYALVTCDSSVVIRTLTVNKPARISGRCTINTANINSGNVYVEAVPGTVNIAPGLTGVEVSLPPAVVPASSSPGGNPGGGGGNPQPQVTITSVSALSAINVLNGTPRSGFTLPVNVNITLSDGSSRTVAVTWDESIVTYDGNTDDEFTYTYSGTITLPMGVTNPLELKPSINVVVGKPSVIGKDAIPDIKVAFGTTNSAITLPASAVVNLSNGKKLTVDIDPASWLSNPVYDVNSAGTFVFTGVMVLPPSILVPADTVISVNVIVPGVAAVAQPATMNVLVGTPVTSLQLPAKVITTLSDATTTEAAVTWNPADIAAYNGNTAGTYTFSGALTLPSGIGNPGGLTATATAIVRVAALNPNPGTPLCTSQGTTVFEFDSLDDCVAASTTGTAIELDNSAFISGTGSIRVSSQTPVIIPGGGGTYDTEFYSFQSAPVAAGALSALENIEFNINVDKTKIDYLLVKFYTDDFHNVFYENGIGGWELSQGWNKIRRTAGDFAYVNSVPAATSISEDRMNKAAVSGEAGLLQQKIDNLNSFLYTVKNVGLMSSAAMAAEAPAGWDTVKCMEVFVVSRVDKDPVVNFDRISTNTTGKAKLLFTFDDAWYDVLVNAYPVLSARSFNATTWANYSGSVDNDISPKEIMDEADLQTLYDAGWDIGNHTLNHPDDISGMSDGQLISEYQDNMNWMLSKGWLRGTYHVCYPSGQYDDRLTGILQQLGVRTARTTDYGIQPVPVTDIYKLKCVAIGRDTPVADILKEIDRAVATGSSLFFMLHKVEVSPSPDNVDEYSNLAVSVANLTQIADYASNYAEQGKLDVVTISQWYDSYMGN